MLKIKQLTLALLYVITLVMLGCSSIDNSLDSELEELLEESEPIEEELGNLTAKVNEIDFDATRSIIGPYLGANLAFLDNGYLLNIYAIDLQLSASRNKTILLYMAGFDFNELQVGSKFDTPNPFSIIALEPGAFAIYAEDLNLDDEIDGEGTDMIEELSIEITAINREERRISGIFSFLGVVEETTETFNVKNGIFTNVSYEIQ